jgi:hypothetical protein
VINLGSPEAPNYQLSLQARVFGRCRAAAQRRHEQSVDHPEHRERRVVHRGWPAGSGRHFHRLFHGHYRAGPERDPGAVGTTTVTVASSLSSVSSELSSFVTAYNAAFAEVEKNTGQNGGALVGDSSVLDMQQALTQMITYAGSSGSITSLAQLGVEFTQQGTLTFDPTVIAGLSQSQISDALNISGRHNSGGFLEYANNTLDSITDPTTGVVVTDTQSLQNQNTQDQTEITNDQAQLTLLQTNLQCADGAGQCAHRDAPEPEHLPAGPVPGRSTSNNPDASTVG